MFDLTGLPALDLAIGLAFGLLFRLPEAILAEWSRAESDRPN